MTGLLIRGGTFGPGAGVKPLILDPILTVGGGSLLLLDVKSWAAGIPANDARLTNIARIQAAGIGLGGSDETAAIFKKVGDLPGIGEGGIERTGKGGLHVAVRQSAPVTVNNGYNIELPDALMAYLIANHGHNIYYSQWRKLTRAAAASSPDGAKVVVGIEASASGGFARFAHAFGQEMPNGVVRTGRTVQGAGLNALGDTRQALSGPYSPGSSEVPLTSQYTSGLARAVAQFGSVARQNSFSPLASALQSWVFYRFYVEDLTVSGRTFAEVDAVDAALWSEAFGVGGRFAADTFTAPSALAA